MENSTSIRARGRMLSGLFELMAREVLPGRAEAVQHHGRVLDVVCAVEEAGQDAGGGGSPTSVRPSAGARASASCSRAFFKDSSKVGWSFTLLRARRSIWLSDEGETPMDSASWA